MTPEQLRQNGLAMIALANGKPIQWANLNLADWTDVETKLYSFDFELFHFRPKAEPISRQWTSDDVPPVCWIRNRSVSKAEVLVIAIDGEGIYGYDPSGVIRVLLFSSISKCEYSTDRKTWKPCTVEVSE